MSRNIVDASILVAGLIADGRARAVLFHTQADLVAPEFVLEELQAQKAKIASRASLPDMVVESLINMFFDRIEIVPRAFFANRLDEARKRCRAADAEGDEDYVALALALDAPIWTYDHDFARIEGVRVLGTKDVETSRR